MADLSSQISASGQPLNSQELATYLDEQDALAQFRSQFLFPKTEEGAEIREAGSETVYLCGNSLGLQPKNVRTYVLQELDNWERYGVEGHFKSKRPWVTIDETVHEAAATVVGAKPIEVAIMNSLTTNLHLMMVPFYRPTETRFKILIEGKAFPSDFLKFHGFDPEVGLVRVEPREGEEYIRNEDVVAAIREHGDSLALVLLGGLQYYTGQAFDIPAITKVAHEVGSVMGVDLAHAVGNLELKLHDWEVDFACWCTYKYLNSGPGNVGGCFVHEKHAHRTDLPRFAGWWGHRKEDRFQMKHEFDPTPGAFGYQLSNPPVLCLAALRASLDLFQEATMPALRAKSVNLTGYLEKLIETELADAVTVLTPKDPAHRGCQLSLRFNVPVKAVYQELSREGVVVDVREPYAMRVAPAPLYNSFSDVRAFVSTLRAVLDRLAA